MLEVNDPGSFAPVPVQSIGDPSLFAGGDHWSNRLNIAVWSALADPLGRMPLPSLTSMVTERMTSPDASKSDFAPLWAGSMQLALYSLGWASPAHGFVKWRETHYSTEDRRLAIIAHLLGQNVDRSVTNLLLFLHLGAGFFFLRKGLRPLEVRGGGPETLELPTWLARFKDSEFPQDSNSPEWTIAYPFGSDFDGMHLVPHCFGPIAKRAEKQGAPVWGSHPRPEDSRHIEVLGEPKNGRAVLITETYTSWYEDLLDLGAGLPPLGDGHSWRVEVFCKPVGWLGTFRRSRHTGLWFSGPHSLHEWGNPDLW